MSTFVQSGAYPGFSIVDTIEHKSFLKLDRKHKHKNAQHKTETAEYITRTTQKTNDFINKLYNLFVNDCFVRSSPRWLWLLYDMYVSILCVC